MPPVAILRRAGLWLAPLGSALVLIASANAAPDSLAEAPSADVPTAPAPVFGALKSGEPAQVLPSRFRFDRRDADDEDAAPAPLEAPRFEKGDYSLGQGVTLGNSGSAFREKGVASWYGKQFHGRKTSSGDSFDMYAMTAAHPSLPIPSYVRVTNLANGRSVVVRINDRGPFHPGRIIDLSYAAAYKLGYADNGQANVELTLMLPEGVAVVQPARAVPPVRKARAPVPALPVVARAAPAQPAATPAIEAPRVAEAVPAPVPPAVAVAAAPAPARAGEPVFLQLGAFGSPVNAEHFKGFVEHELKWLKSSVSVLATEGKYRLQLGPFPSAPEARSIAERIAATLKLKPVVKGRD